MSGRDALRRFNAVEVGEDAYAITAGQLRIALEAVPDDVIVVLARGEDGSGFSPLAEASGMLYVAETESKGETFFLDEMIDQGTFTGMPHAPEDAVPAITLWPTDE